MFFFYFKYYNICNMIFIYFSITLHRFFYFLSELIRKDYSKEYGIYKLLNLFNVFVVIETVSIRLISFMLGCCILPDFNMEALLHTNGSLSGEYFVSFHLFFDVFQLNNMIIDLISNITLFLCSIIHKQFINIIVALFKLLNIVYFLI